MVLRTCVSVFFFGEFACVCLCAWPKMYLRLRLSTHGQTRLSRNLTRIVFFACVRVCLCEVIFVHFSFFIFQESYCWLNNKVENCVNNSLSIGRLFDYQYSCILNFTSLPLLATWFESKPKIHPTQRGWQFKPHRGGWNVIWSGRTCFQP